MVKLELSLHARKLKNVAGAFKGTSDPFAVVTIVASRSGEAPTVLGKTEVYVACRHAITNLEKDVFPSL